MTEIRISRQFAGPPNSGNGGYVSGLLARGMDGPVTAVLRAPAPFDVPLRLVREGEAAQLIAPDGLLIAQAAPAVAGLDTPAPPPAFAEAARAGTRFPGLTQMFHPICVCCAPVLEEGVGLRVFVGQTESEPEGCVSGAWSPHPAFCENGVARLETVWTALDCPGSVAWWIKEGSGGLLGTMTCEVRRAPAAGEACIVTAWPLERSGRKRFAGTALFAAEGELLAHSHQIWIGRP